MGGKLFSVLIGAILILACATAQAEETPAKRKTGVAPDFPASCRPPIGEEINPQIVTVTYTVTKEGEPKGVRVRESTDSCFNETAVAAVRGWVFDPMRVDGHKEQQVDVETTFIFRFEASTYSADFDARPRKRAPPTYPHKCMRKAQGRDEVMIQFDVTPEGRTDNIQVLESTYECFNAPAIKSVEQWVYTPKRIGGESVVRRNMQVLIFFVLEGGGAPFRAEVDVRPLVYRNFRRVQDSMKEERYEEAMSKLGVIEERFAATFSQDETLIFYRLRGVARLVLKDYAGALDDLRIAKKAILDEETGIALQDTIGKLEMYIAVQEAEAAAAQQQLSEAPPAEANE